MRKPDRIFAAALAFLLLLVFLGGVKLVRDLRGFEIESVESMLWNSTQLETEMLRLGAAALAFQSGKASRARDVKRRFDLVMSRLALFESGHVGDMLLSIPTNRTTIEALNADLSAIDGAVISLRDGETEKVEPLLALLERHALPVRQVVLNALHEDAQTDSDQQTNLRSGIIFIGIASLITFVVMGAVLASYLVSARHHAQLARAADSANRSRQQLFRHMSHELRTPLNGLLGAFSLIRHERDESTRQSYINEGEAAANRLSDLVTSAVELGSEQADAGHTDIFRMSDLIASLEELLAPEVRRLGTRLDLQVDCAIDGFYRGHFRGINHVVSNLLLHTIRSNKGGEVTLSIAPLDDSGIKLTIDNGEGTNGLEPRFTDSLSDIAADKLGARLTVAQSQTTLEFPISAATPSASLHFASKVIERAYTRLLNAEGVQIVDQSAQNVDLVICDASLPEAEISRLRSFQPSARFIGCGAGGDAMTDFDGIVRAADNLPQVLLATLRSSQN